MGKEVPRCSSSRSYFGKEYIRVPKQEDGIESSSIRVRKVASLAP
ncbi:hypothetical protein Gotur_027609 [Gossypium turneri]